MLRRLALMSALDYDRIFLFTLSDLDQRASVRDRDYGLLDLDANPKPVYPVSYTHLLVVDSRSSDDTVERFRAFGARVEVIEPASFNHGGTRRWASQQMCIRDSCSS